jgi:ribonuclease E
MNDPTRGSAQPPGPPQPPADGDTGALRAYRDAAAQAGEAPRAETRAAILAAAARQVQARPQPVGRAAPLTRYRAPLALAASLLVGTIAWQLSAQFDEPALTDTVQEAPATAPAGAPSGAVTAPASEAAAVPPPPAAARSEEAPRERADEAQRAAPVAPSVDEAARRAAQGAAASAALAPATPPARPGDHDMASKPTSEERAAVSPPPTKAPATASDRSPPAPPQVAAPSAAPSTAPAGASNESAAAAAAPAPPQSAPPRPAALRMAPAPSAPPVGGATSESLPAKAAPAPAEEQVRIQPVERRRFNEDAAPRPLEAWLAQVIELRAAGRDADADRELQALRKHYPQAQIPAAALPAAER